MWKLQWGRNLTVAEGLLRKMWQTAFSPASMGPQLDSCGRLAAYERPTSVWPASMGPQLDSCGRHRILLSGTSIDWLQWGRNLTVAEGIINEYGSVQKCTCFNGAAT